MSNFILQAWGRYRRQTGAAREITTLAACVVIGLFVVPLLIWLGGQLVLGEYQRAPALVSPTVGGGPVALWLDYLQGLGQGSVGYWMALTGPYVIYMVLRLARRIL
ncbi:MAG: hypothetical protein ABI859_12670 [Pseudomonadota bacterium]